MVTPNTHPGRLASNIERTRAPRLVASIVTLALAFAMASISPAAAGDMPQHSSQSAARSGPLDGKVFTGLFGLLGKSAQIRDTYTFTRGTFMSTQCEDCGYPRGIYRTHRGPDGKMHFVAETPCPKTDARIVWRGTIEKGRLEGVATWTRKRWYRTIKKKYWFRGSLRPSERAARKD